MINQALLNNYWYGWELVEAHLFTMGILPNSETWNDYHHNWYHAVSAVEPEQFWCYTEEIECEDCPDFDAASDEADVWGDWLNEYCRPDYSGISGEQDYERALNHLQLAAEYLHFNYPLV